MEKSTSTKSVGDIESFKKYIDILCNKNASLNGVIFELTLSHPYLENKSPIDWIKEGGDVRDLIAMETRAGNDPSKEYIDTHGAETIESLKEKIYKMNIGYLDLVELIRYDSKTVYDKIFNHGHDGRIQLIIDRQVTSKHAEKVVEEHKAMKKLLKKIVHDKTKFERDRLSLSLDDFCKAEELVNSDLEPGVSK